MKQFFKTVIILICIICIIGTIFLGFAYGFPWERISAMKYAKKYVIETYHFTPIQVQASILFDEPICATVSTKENKFYFEVIMDRHNLKNIIGDNYLESLASYNLDEELQNAIRKRSNSNIYTYIGDNGSIVDKNMTKDIINSDELFIKSKDEYYCEISFKNVKKQNFKIDYKIDYNLLKDIMNSKLQPYQLEFSYYTDKGWDDCITSIIIKKEDFESINCAEDLAAYIENNKSSSN